MVMSLYFSLFARIILQAEDVFDVLLQQEAIKNQVSSRWSCLSTSSLFAHIILQAEDVFYVLLQQDAIKSISPFTPNPADDRPWHPSAFNFIFRGWNSSALSARNDLHKHFRRPPSPPPHNMGNGHCGCCCCCIIGILSTSPSPPTHHMGNGTNGSRG